MLRTNGHTHLLGGLAAGALLAPALAFGHIPAFLIAAVLAGPLADIDHPGSMYGKWVPLPGVAKINGQVEPFRRGPFGNSQRSFGHVGRVLPGGILWHRAATHSFTVALAFSAAFYLLAGRLIAPEATAIGLGVLTGYLSHLALDALNVAGQQLLWPFSRKPVRPPWPRIPVGSLGEMLTVVALVGGLLLWAPRILSTLRLPHGL
ncbi:MAG: metal-dependent hydrolase [Thermaerobacter sp.]|nr:metal-dependent hydrolase [Thermaerobacter sp.]